MITIKRLSSTLLWVGAVSCLLGTPEARSEPAAAPGALEQQITSQVFDAAVRDASLALLEILSKDKSAPGFAEEVQRGARSLYLQARRYRQAYGARGWKEGGKAIEEVFSSAEMVLIQASAPEAPKQAIHRYLATLESLNSAGR
jgi:hypothetical protein